MQEESLCVNIKYCVCGKFYIKSNPENPNKLLTLVPILSVSAYANTGVGTGWHHESGQAGGRTAHHFTMCFHQSPPKP